MIPKFVFRGFEKACHFEYKFDSKTEQDFAYVLENEVNVRRWLRPAPNQFRIYWDNNSKRYEPDFVVETTNCIYMIETKAEKDLDNDDVQAKKKAAETYCKFATEYTTANGGKPWKYLLIPHTVVSRTASFEFIVMQSS
jgi:type III restriction enzyme